MTQQGQVDYVYDNASRRASTTVAGQTAITYTYDNANRLTQVQRGSDTVTLAYDDADRRTSVTYPNGNKIESAYNAASELTSLTFKHDTTTLGDLTYTYDAAGNRIKTGGTFARSNLPPALSTVSYNANNQQTTFGSNTITYDLNGNLATVTESGVTTTYTWNVRNQLTGISNTGFSASFTYDSFGRRTGKTIQSTTTNFVYDGLNPVQEKDGSTVTANLIPGLGIDEFFQRTDGVGSRALLTDALGSTIALGDGSGTLQTQYTYEPFGYTTQSGQANSNSYKYTGREDDDSGLYYYRARYYHPRLQRFIAEDPIGFEAGDTNFYAYVFDNPINLNDPSGNLAPLVIAGGVIGAYANSMVYLAMTPSSNVTLAGLGAAALGGAIAGGVGVIATPIAASIGLGSGVYGTLAVNAGIGAFSGLVSAGLDPCQRVTAGYLLSSAGFGALGGYMAKAAFPTTGMSVFAQVGFPRTLSGVIPTWLGGRAGINAMNAIYSGGVTAGSIGAGGPAYTHGQR